MKRVIRIYLVRIFRRLCAIFPVMNRKVIVSNYYGKGYGDNAKYIVEKLLQYDKRVNIIWIINSEFDKETLPSGIIPCQRGSFREIYHLSTAKIWIDNCRKDFWNKKSKQIYMQTWHGFALKRIEKDVSDSLSDDYKRIALRDSSQIDIIVSDSDFMSHLYRNSFWYSGEVVKWGAPRNDILITHSDDIKKKISKYYELAENKKIILYAPTFRVDGNIDVYSLDCQSVIDACEQRFGGKFAIFLKLHPNIVDKCSLVMDSSSSTINATFYPDTQELLAAADVVISDYSSLMFDFAITKKPCFIFATDIESYKSDRNFYYDIRTTPFLVSENNEELCQSIKNFNNNLYINDVNNFFNKHSILCDGHSSERCASWILSQINTRRS